MNQNLHVLILKLYKTNKNVQEKFSITYTTLNLPAMIWKMDKFENFMTNVTKAQFKERKWDFSLTLAISNWEITHFVSEQEKLKIFKHKDK